jgi:hypothetical protein
VLPDEPETSLEFRWDRILQPEQAMPFEALSKLRRLYWGKAVMHVVEKHWLGTELGADTCEQLRYQVQIPLSTPALFRWKSGFGRLIVQISSSNTICAL